MENLLNKYLEFTYLYHEGTQVQSHEMLGAHFTVEEGQDGVRFSLYAPNAKAVWVVGDFNNWQDSTHPMERLEGTPIFSIAFKSVMKSHPPGSGVPVPGKTEGSSTSRSMDTYTGLPFSLLMIASSPSLLYIDVLT